jgi:hypothetical protein
MSDFGNFSDKYLEFFNPATKSLELRYKSQTEGNLTLTQTMDLIDDLLAKYQTYYTTSDYDKNLIFFPFMFIIPKEGDKLLNENTKEIYTVDQIIRNPETNQWQGLVRLNLNSKPNRIAGENLTWITKDRYVKFDHAYSTASPNEINANNSGDELNSPPMIPEISWFIQTKEPAGIGGSAFSPRKEYKSRLRDTVKDPVVDGYTVEIYGQWFDNIVQFDAWYANNRATENLAEWFEQFMRHHNWMLRKYGVNQSFFWKRIVDETKQQWRQPVWKRSIQYYFRTEQLEAVYQRDLLKLDFNIELASGGQLPTNLGKRYIADQLVSGQLSASGYRSLFYDQSGNFVFGNINILQ